jgi:ectoine hydroxylase-related dioxygenase (phytanoyl-CoA dioxygenase family)
MGDYNWGDDNIILNNDKNLLEDTDFDNVGYKVFDIKDMHDMNIRLQNILKEEIYKVCNKNINLEKYHNEITEDEHKIILNSMPYKKNSTDKINEFGNYIIDFVSSKLNKKIKIFNDDIWFRICRPSKNYMNDFNPCHKDIYLDFYRNVINIYLPIVGSNENSTLMIEQSSHKWNENETIVTKDGAYFKNINKKYSVDAVVASKKPLNMYRPNPSIDQVMIFSPYLIHGCANNNNEDTTRISIEIRFIMDDNSGINQENDFNKFLKMRHWR